MKTRDLMQGDKVYETLLEDTPQVVTVEEVGQKHIYIGTADDDMALLRYEPKYLGWNIEHIEPIPLTEEILKANGFKCRKTYACPRYSYIDDKGHKLISFLRDRDGYEMQVGGNRVRLLYTHQLQHALRLCGLNKLADNFKL